MKKKKEVYLFYNELNREEVVYRENDKFFVIIESKHIEISKEIFETYKNMCWKYDYNVTKNKKNISLNACIEKLECSQGDRYSYALRRLLMDESKSIEEKLIEKNKIEKIKEVASKHKNGAYIINKLLDGYKDVEIAEEIGLERHYFSKVKKSLMDKIKKELKDDF